MVVFDDILEDPVTEKFEIVTTSLAINTYTHATYSGTSDEPNQQVISEVTYHLCYRLMKCFGTEGDYF